MCSSAFSGADPVLILQFFPNPWVAFYEKSRTRVKCKLRCKMPKLQSDPALTFIFSFKRCSSRARLAPEQPMDVPRRPVFFRADEKPVDCVVETKRPKAKLIGRNHCNRPPLASTTHAREGSDRQILQSFLHRLEAPKLRVSDPEYFHPNARIRIVYRHKCKCQDGCGKMLTLSSETPNGATAVTRESLPRIDHKAIQDK